MYFKKIITVIVLILVIVGVFVFFGQKKTEDEKINGVIVGGKTFSVEIVDTDALREKGLSGHAPLLDDQGMLFIFPASAEYGFWMKDMLFSIDIIWIDSNLQIVHIEKTLKPETYPTVFNPGAKSLYVLEISAGQADSLKIKTGEVVKFIKN